MWLVEGRAFASSGLRAHDDVASGAVGKALATARAEPRLGRVQLLAPWAGPAHAGLTQIQAALAPIQQVLEFTQLAVRSEHVLELVANQVLALAAEPVHVEDQAAEVAQLELAPLAQEPHATAQPAALTQTQPPGLRLRRRLGANR
jgi:hypothetical protein